MNAGVVEVDGERYSWSVHRQQSWVTSVGLNGLALLVQSENGNRELILQFDGVMGHRMSMGQMRFKVSNKRIIECIRTARESGWDPESRGKKFVFSAGKPN
jgi:hypothetical protein